jgi:hypothetical protein
MREQVQAASTLQTINRNTGVTRDSGDYAALVGQIEATANARGDEIAKLKAEEAATAELSRAKENQIRVNQLLNVNTGTGKSAQASANVFTGAQTEETDQLAASDERSRAGHEGRSRSDRESEGRA